MKCPLIAIAILVLATAAWSQTYRPARTGGLLVGDRSTNAVWHLTDLNLDKDYVDPGEIALWYTGATGPIANTIQDLAFGVDGTCFLSDSAARSVYALVDFNLDGDADDLGESWLYFGPGNASGINPSSTSGMTVVPGVPADIVWIACASTGAVPIDGLIRCQDLNGNGNALDAGEAVYWWEKSVSMANGGPDIDLPTSVVVDDNHRVFLVHGGGVGAAKGIYLLQDLGGTPGANDAGEVSFYWAAPTAQAPFIFDIGLTRAGEIWAIDRGNFDALYLLNDLNFDDQITGTEQVTYWVAGAASLVDNVAEIVEWDGGTALLLLEDQAPDRILRLKDLNLNGTIENASEVFEAYSDLAPGVFDIVQPKAIAAIPGPVLAGPEFLTPGDNVTVTHTSVRGHVFHMAISTGSQPMPLPPFGLFQLDQFYLVILEYGFVPASGTYEYNASTPPIPGLTGVQVHAQSVDFDGRNGYLSNRYTLTFN